MRKGVPNSVFLSAGFRMDPLPHLAIKGTPAQTRKINSTTVHAVTLSPSCLYGPLCVTGL